ncbi:lipid-binding SYLF domain-containing protein [Thiohalocapsa marina]|uniref:Lipid-binding SYLF domain-containing protein n=1 Tax=Thiohalocapsa marina TaxID=424902 RepID=A0A5M8FGQ5_9GAMM|nr:lipid-binding SYLF domain-containing protein [Thiohalocapsa marina]KAA6182251.1 lipid-binding SYLF domain-containing protein [Thiohalocapsa marina]
MSLQIFIRISMVFLLIGPWGSARADKYLEAVYSFATAGESSQFFGNSYGYAVFPTIGKAGFGWGGASGEGRVYVEGEHVGDARMTEMTIGWQLGAQVYSMIIFFQDRRAFEEFTSSSFEFSAQANAVAITSSVSAAATTAGASAGASKNRYDASTLGVGYHKGMAVFTIAKGGLMYEASLGGQRFTYTPLGGG